MKILVTTLVALLALTGCAYHEEVALPPSAPNAAVVPPPPAPRTAGSLWGADQNGLFADSRARQVGDILTVAIFESASASKESSTTTGRTSSMEAGIDNLLGFETNIASLKSGLNPAKLVDANFTNSFEGSGETSRKEALTATLTTQVVEVLPNGNLRIEGSKTVTVNSETQIVHLAGIVRPVDVSVANIVDSKAVLDARITYTGKGVISDKQRPGWLVRLFDAVTPF